MQTLALIVYSCSNSKFQCQLLNSQQSASKQKCIVIKKANAADFKGEQYEDCSVSTVCPGVMFIFHYLGVSLETAFNSRCQGNSSVILELYWTLQAEKIVQLYFVLRTIRKCFK